MHGQGVRPPQSPPTQKKKKQLHADLHPWLLHPLLSKPFISPLYAEIGLKKHKHSFAILNSIMEFEFQSSFAHAIHNLESALDSI